MTESKLRTGRLTYQREVAEGKSWRNVFLDGGDSEVPIPRGASVRLRPVLVAFDPTPF